MSKDKKSFFEEKFGFKKNPKVEKAKDARKEKQLKKQYGDGDDKWEYQDQFDKARDRKKPFAKDGGADRKDKRNYRDKDGASPDRKDRKPFSKEGRDADRKDKKPFNDRYAGSPDRKDRKPFSKEGRDADRKDKKPFNDRYAGSPDRKDRKPFDKEGRDSDRKGRKPFGDRDGDTGRRAYGSSGSADGQDKRRSRDKDGDRRSDKNLPAKKTASRIFEKDKPEREVFYTEEDRKRLFGEEAFKDRVLKELKDEIDQDFDAVKKEKAQKKKEERRGRKEKNKESEDYGLTKYIDDESDYEIAYEAAGGKKWQVENAMDNNYRKPVGEEEEMPLNKYIAYCGVCSRRDAVPLIKSGKISVEGEVCKEPGFKVTRDTNVTMDGKKLSIQKNIVYVLMNKPKGYITTTDDPKDRKTVMDLVSNHIEERIFPVGRLDRNTTGLLLLTNDGDLAQQLAHPKYEIRKIYHVVLDKNLSKTDFDKIAAGVELEDGIAPVDHIAYLEKKNEIGIEIHSGKNRIVRRIFESCGYVVEKLDRVMYAGLTKKNIPRGKWRLLSKQEIINLKHLNKGK